MSVRIIEVFVKIRELLLTHKDILLKLEIFEKQIIRNSDDIQILSAVLKELLNPPGEPRKQIGYKPNGEA